ncbi:hypothetical protein HHL08_24585 [Sphingobium sp. AR-3-1]|uniref:Uncharacterized protein n=2 Tax=Sphingobium psychrophilum TaxID=2728834 RepID=A0A7X9ZUH1_9SPHN|nr:hypothetical protein [Sphingobium psychrophilum]
MNFALFPDGVYVLADTLVTTDQFEPGFFTSKVHPVPHLNGLICGTGNLAFILDWSRHVLGRMLAVDMGHLNDFASDSLRTLYAARPAAERKAMTSTIYHLGFDDQENQFVGFAYRSTADFESERLEPGIRTKPPYIGALPLTGFPNDFVEVCRAQRVEQDAIIPAERVFIGGHLTAYMMQVDRMENGAVAVVTTITRPFEFEDFETMYLVCASTR